MAAAAAAVAAMVAPPDSAPAPALGAGTGGAVIGSQTQPALFIITTNAPNFIPTLVQTCSHSVTRSFGVVSDVARAVSQPLRKRSAESTTRATRLIRVLHVKERRCKRRSLLQRNCFWLLHHQLGQESQPRLAPAAILRETSTNLDGGFIAFALHRYL